MKTCQFLFKIEKEPGIPTVSRHSCFTKQKCKQRHQICSEFSNRFVSEIPIAFSCGAQSLAFQKYLRSAWKNKIFKKPVSNCPPFRGSLLTLGMYSVALLTVFLNVTNEAFSFFSRWNFYDSYEYIIIIIITLSTNYLKSIDSNYAQPKKRDPKSN